MKKEKKLSIKDRLTIKLKSTKPARFAVLVIVCVILLVGLIAIGLFDKPVKLTPSPDALSKENVQFRMTITGNVVLDDDVRKLANNIGFAHILDGVSTYWADSDVVVANINAPVLENDVSTYKLVDKGINASISHIDIQSLQALMDAGITLPSFANDSVFDFGVDGVTSTMNVLNTNGIPYLGLAENKDEVYYKTYEFPLSLKDGSERTGSVSVVSINDIVRDESTVTDYRPGIVNSGVTSSYYTVYQLAQSSDQVIVYIHFGQVNSPGVTDDQREMARRLIDAGADIVVGTHSQMIQSAERYADGLIIYDLGDLITNQEYSVNCDGALFDLVVDNNGEVFVYLTPTHILEGCPTVTSNSLYLGRIQKAMTNLLVDDDFVIMDDGTIRISVDDLNTNS